MDESEPIIHEGPGRQDQSFHQTVVALIDRKEIKIDYKAVSTKLDREVVGDDPAAIFR